MKNLSLYVDALSIPRKQDVDAKQDKVVVSGLLKGDGNGNISAAVAGTDYLTTAPVSSVNGKTGAVTLTASDVGAVDLTSEQTIEGPKTFSGDVYFDNSDYDTTFYGGFNTDTATCTFGGPVHLESTVDFSKSTVVGLNGLLPTVTTSNNGQFLRVVDGVWSADTVPNANGVSF